MLLYDRIIHGLADVRLQPTLNSTRVFNRDMLSEDWLSLIITAMYSDVKPTYLT